MNKNTRDEVMGKTFRYKKNTHAPNPEELADRDWKHQKNKQKQKPRSPSMKQIHGHFTQQHIWPLTNTKRKGRQKI